jgi:hypothetical protein
MQKPFVTFCKRVCVYFARHFRHMICRSLRPRTSAYGRVFEQFVILESNRMNDYLEPDFRFSYLRTKDDAEIDLIVERPGPGCSRRPDHHCVEGPILQVRLPKSPSKIVGFEHPSIFEISGSNRNSSILERVLRWRRSPAPPPGVSATEQSKERLSFSIGRRISCGRLVMASLTARAAHRAVKAPHGLGQEVDLMTDLMA